MNTAGLSIGNGGWVRVWLEGKTEKPYVLVRFADFNGQLRAQELYLEGPVTDRVLRFLSVRVLADIVNIANASIGEAIRARLAVAAPDLRAFASYYGTTGSSVPANPPRAAEPRRAPRRSSVDARLTIPTARRYPDAFFDDVWAVRSRLRAARLPVAPTIAAANDVPITTAARWIKRARALGGPGRKARGAGHWD